MRRRTASWSPARMDSCSRSSRLDVAPAARAEEERRFPVRVLEVRVRAGGEERLDHLRVASQGGEHERGRATLILGVDFHPGGQKRLHAREVAGSSGIDQLLARKKNDPEE